ncbi:DUF362 domain-containing protein [Kosmotoga pacifica]|uniref:DUF362 domain-containing protein n=1 Tax=Kosmotoga pacifica TaxID=1330330 RepID=UPI0009E497F5|nr:4Fe-4S binding protein [Kosmotoga pacifica]
MPWIRESDCTGCQLCIKTCPVEGVITMRNGKAYIDNSLCIRCGKCFDVCPKDAIRPNSENPLLRGRGMGQGLGMGHGRNRGY